MEGTEGVIAIFNTKTTSLSSLVLPPNNPLIMVAEAPEKPGNIGALFRTADAAGADAMNYCQSKYRYIQSKYHKIKHRLRIYQSNCISFYVRNYHIS